MTKMLVAIAFGLMASVVATGASAQVTLTSVKQKGFLTCGASSGSIGFGMPDAQGNWTGLDVDFCRAIAAAIFDDPTKVRFIPLNAKDRFTALQAGEVDVLSRNSTHDHVARHPARPRFPGHHLLRRPGLHGPQEARRRPPPRN